MKNTKAKAKIEKLSSEEMRKVCGGANEQPIVVIIDGKTVIIWP